MDQEVREGLGRGWKVLMGVGIAAIVVGCIAILVPAVAAVGTAIGITGRGYEWAITSSGLRYSTQMVL